MCGSKPAYNCGVSPRRNAIKMFWHFNIKKAFFATCQVRVSRFLQRCNSFSFYSPRIPLLLLCVLQFVGSSPLRSPYTGISASTVTITWDIPEDCPEGSYSLSLGDGDPEVDVSDNFDEIWMV